MSKYINGLQLDSDNPTRKVVTEKEQVKYYPNFRGSPDLQKVNEGNTALYDGGDVNGW